MPIRRCDAPKRRSAPSARRNSRRDHRARRRREWTRGTLGNGCGAACLGARRCRSSDGNGRTESAIEVPREFSKRACKPGVRENATRQNASFGSVRRPTTWRTWQASRSVRSRGSVKAAMLPPVALGLKPWRSAACGTPPPSGSRCAPPWAGRLARTPRNRALRAACNPRSSARDR